jgi:hypothetical protein
MVHISYGGAVTKIALASEFGARGQYCSVIKISRIATGLPQAGPERIAVYELVCVLSDAIAHASGE